MEEQIKKQKAPNSIPALVMGATSLGLVEASMMCSSYALVYSLMPYMEYSVVFLCVFAVAFAIAVVVLSVIGGAKAKEGYEKYNEAPDAYMGVGMLKAGKIMSRIGLILGIISIVFVIIVIVVYNVCDFGFGNSYYYY